LTSQALNRNSAFYHGKTQGHTTDSRSAKLNTFTSLVPRFSKIAICDLKDSHFPFFMPVVYVRCHSCCGRSHSLCCGRSPTAPPRRPRGLLPPFVERPAEMRSAASGAIALQSAVEGDCPNRVRGSKRMRWGCPMPVVAGLRPRHAGESPFAWQPPHSRSWRWVYNAIRGVRGSAVAWIPCRRVQHAV